MEQSEVSIIKVKVENIQTAVRVASAKKMKVYGQIFENVQTAVRVAMEAVNWKRFITEGTDVSLKVNLGWDIFLPGSVTSPWVVEGVIQTIRDYVGKIYLVESDQILVNCEKSLRQTRIDRLCSKYNIEWVNMSKGKFIHKKLENGLVFKEVDCPEILTRTELITIPVMKTHDKTAITGAIKNQWGCLNKLRHNYHLVLDEALVDINSICLPKFAVLDGTVCLEGNSPKSGTPKIMDLIMASADIVALDTVQAEVMEIDSTKLSYLGNCSRHNLGRSNLSDIKIKGMPIEEVKSHFIPAQHNFVSLIELNLRKSPLKALVFGTPILDICCFGAIWWYYLWYFFKGRKLRDKILKDSVYGEQWR